jgi:hypothetical protein
LTQIQNSNVGTIGLGGIVEYLLYAYKE